MKCKSSLLAAIALTQLISCKREPLGELNSGTSTSPHLQPSSGPGFPAADSIQGYTTYTIGRGEHFCDKSTLESVNTPEMRFYARFNQSAIYQTSNPGNQGDINKLWGFSEGNNNHFNSARIGWRYSDGSVRLFGYVYAAGVVYSNEITTVVPGEDIYCSIKISGNTYLLSAKGITVSLPRGASGTEAFGFQQYPYFGGDETAPHGLYINIKPL